VTGAGAYAAGGRLSTHEEQPARDPACVAGADRHGHGFHRRHTRQPRGAVGRPVGTSEDLELLREFRRTRASDVGERLVERHVGLVKCVAAWVAGRLPRHVRRDDLYSAGMLGFFDAITRYDPDRGVPFSAFAGARIRGAILDELRRLDVVPRRTRRKLVEAQRAIEALARELDREPTEEEVAGRLDIDVAEYRRLRGEGVTLVSLDGSGRDVRLDGLADTSLPSPLRMTEDTAQRHQVGQLIDRLPARERRVLALYYYEELTMQEIADVLGVTESRVSQVHSSAVLRLRGALRRERPRRALRTVPVSR
jgi:RNA polymerase sigma factor FliA